MTRLIALTAFLATVVAAVPAAAAEMTCGTRIVELGMSRSEVLQLCGEPTSRDVDEQPVHSGNRVTGSTTVERWTYATYSRTRTLIFDQDRLTSID